VKASVKTRLSGPDRLDGSQRKQRNQSNGEITKPHNYSPGSAFRFKRSGSAI
jgi:hypothetical protein